MSNLIDALYESLHSSSHASLQRALREYLDEGLDKGKSEINSLKAASEKLVSRAHIPSQNILLLAGVAGLAAAVYFYGKQKAEHESESTDGESGGDPAESRKTVTTKTVLINRPREELFSFWRDFRHLPRFMENIESVDVDGKHSTWKIKAPAGRIITVESELVEEIENEKLAWKSTENSQIESEGYIAFRDAPGGRGTYVEARIAYKPPAGELGRLIARMFGREPEAQARHDLKRFKMLMETGEIATSDKSNQE